MYCAITYPIELAISPQKDKCNLFLKIPENILVEKCFKGDGEFYEDFNIVGNSYKEDCTGRYILLLNCSDGIKISYGSSLINVDIETVRVEVEKDTSIWGLTYVKIFNNNQLVFSTSFFDYIWKFNCYIPCFKGRSRSRAWEKLKVSLEYYLFSTGRERFEKKFKVANDN